MSYYGFVLHNQWAYYILSNSQVLFDFSVVASDRGRLGLEGEG